LSVLKGDEYTVLEKPTLAASTTDSYYFPPGRRVGGTTDVDGLHQRIIWKEWGIAVQNSDVRITGIFINYRDGTRQAVFGDGGAQVTVGNGSAYDPDVYQLTIDIQDISNIEFSIANNSGAESRTFYAWIRYEPLRPGEKITDIQGNSR